MEPVTIGAQGFGAVFDARGPCAKRRVRCAIVTPDGEVFEAENDCANPQRTCPRLPGEDYAKCQSICRQAEHAEVGALRKAGARAKGATAIVTGHNYICSECGKALEAAGVATVIIKLNPA